MEQITTIRGLCTGRRQSGRIPYQTKDGLHFPHHILIYLCASQPGWVIAVGNLCCMPAVHLPVMLMVTCEACLLRESAEALAEIIVRGFDHRIGIYGSLICLIIGRICHNEKIQTYPLLIRGIAFNEFRQIFQSIGFLFDIPDRRCLHGSVGILRQLPAV